MKTKLTVLLFAVLLPLLSTAQGVKRQQPIRKNTVTQKRRVATSPTVFFKKGLAYYKSESYREAAKWFFMAAEAGHAEAQCFLGVCYDYGQGVAENDGEAVKWYRKAAEQGLVHAQVILGDCYYGGEGVSKNYEEAVKWYRKAAEQGHPGAQYNLGNCYYKGEGVAENEEEAIKWYRKAAEQGDEDAKSQLTELESAVKY